MSSINPNNINGSYPIAGQDNDSQGFRDNFTNIKNNLTFAQNEITDLEEKVLLTEPLADGTFSNEMNFAQIKSAQLLKTVETTKDLGQQTSTIVSFADGHYQRVQTAPSSPLTISQFSNWPTSGLYAKLRLEVQVTSDAATETLTLPSSGITWSGLTDIQGAVGQTITFPATGKYVFEITTYNSGTTLTIEDLTRNRNNVTGNFTITGRLALSGSEDLAASGAASLVKTASYFTTSTAETATLAAGTDGQIKTFAMVADGGDMVITVTNAGWKASGTGTITFDTIGDGCTLQYVASKWFCIGNNGVTFA
jgi:hypothetical protein